jgi:YegS/Rv2252/BmrU family lipid kinase
MIAGMANVALVLNPTKVADPQGLVAQLTDVLSAHGWPAPMVLETTVSDPGRGMAERAVADGAEIVIAAGGDGTVASVVSGLAGSPAALAILPSGTGNLLARNLDLPMATEDVLAAVVGGRTTTMDVGEMLAGPAVGLSFAVMAGMGFDAAIMDDAPEKLKGAVGWPAYIIAALGHLADEPFEVTLVLDHGEPMVRTARTVLVANVATLQGGIELAPEAGVTDGQLDVIVIAPQNVGDWVRLGARLAFGSDREDGLLERFQAKHVEVLTGQPQMCQIDGDPLEPAHELVAEVRPRSLKLRVPASRDPA